MLNVNFHLTDTLGAQVNEEMTLGPLRKAIEGRVRRGDWDGRKRWETCLFFPTWKMEHPNAQCMVYLPTFTPKTAQM